MNLVRLIVALGAAVIVFRSAAAADADQQKINTAVDALTRLQNVQLDEKPAVKAAVDRLLEKTRGTANFVRLVRHFNLTNRNAELLEVTMSGTNAEAGVEALRWVLASKDVSAIRTGITHSNATNAGRLVQALGSTKEKQAIPLLEPLIAGESEPLVVRRAAVRALAQTQDGAGKVLKAAREQALADDLKFVAASELHASRWPEIKSEAATVLPLPVGQNATPLPPVTELVRMKGDVTRGAIVFKRDSVACNKCHKVGTDGQEVGPALTEIGTKLAREALYESILDPSAGISLGYEAWTVELKSGDEIYGLKASETPEEVAIKDTNGIITRYKRADIVSLRQGKTSIMPSGLQATMTTQELVDLVEYLMALKKPNS
jgi:putative heme-binding domain-containing protein